MAYLREDMPSSGRSDVENLADPSRWKVLGEDSSGEVSLTDGRRVVRMRKEEAKKFLSGEGKICLLEESG